MLTGHELDDVVTCLDKDHLDMIGIAILELLLEEPTAMLVLAQAVNLAFDLIQLDLGKASLFCWFVSWRMIGSARRTTDLHRSVHDVPG